MIIKCAKKRSSNNQLQGGQAVNIVGKYLYNHIDGAFKFEKNANTYDVYFTLLYQLPINKRDHNLGEENNDVHEMTINLSVTTYGDKIRVNILEVTPNERTLGFKTFSLEKTRNLKELQEEVLQNVRKKVSKAYEDYDFLF